MQKRFATILCLLVLSASPALEAQLRLHGSNTVGEELAPALVSAWLEQDGYDQIEIRQQAELERTLIGSRPDGQQRWVEIHAHGSGTAFRDLRAGSADIGMSSRRIRPAEAESLDYMGELARAPNEVVIGIDGLAVIVHRDNPVREMSIEQIRAAFSGRVINWRELGGNDAPISIYARDEKSGTFDSFDSMVMQGTDIDPSAARFESSSELSDSVAGDRNGIGFIGLPYIRDARAIAVLSGDTAVLPERFSSATEDYPLSRRLYLYVPDRELGGLGGSLARFVIGDTGQQIVDRIGFIGQSLEVRRVRTPDNAPDRYRQFVDGALRASVNFRFERGRPELDTKSQRDFQRLVDFLREPENRHYQVMLMGFADPSETMSYFALTLSNDRVDYVASLLTNAGITVRRARGFGDSLLLAEGTGAQSEAKNRRVEVWLHANRRTGDPPASLEQRVSD